MRVNGINLIFGLFALLLSSAVYGGWHFGWCEAAAQEDQCNTTAPSMTSKGKQSNSWRGIVPLSSTRTEVEDLLGKGKPHINGYSFIYENDTGRIDILYSAGPCKLSGVERWNVPKDVVIRIDVAPRRTILVQDLCLDPKKYLRIQLSHPSHWFQYRNKEDGIVVQTIASAGAEEVYIIGYEPRVKDKPLLCKDN